jgi:hypothetical protein
MDICICFVYYRCTATISESSDPLHLSLESRSLDQQNHISNICLSSFENPSTSKVRLHQLLRQVEKEFEIVLIENISLRKELERYNEINNHTHGVAITNKLRAGNIIPMIKNRVVLRTGNQSDDLLFSSNKQHRDVIWDVQVRFVIG